MRHSNRLSDELRNGRGEFLAHRRSVAVLALTTISSMALVALYQFGILKRLRQPRLPHFNTEKVHASNQAYALLDVPDAVLGLGSYAVTLGLAATGAPDRFRTHPWIPLAFAGKALADAAQAGKLTRDAWVKQGAFSIYSLIAAAATFATLPLVLPEARAAWNSRKHRCG